MASEALDPKAFIVYAISSSEGPPKGLALGLKRRTIGKVINGDAFDVTDDWTSGSQAHRFLKDGWTGRTELISVASIVAAVVYKIVDCYFVLQVFNIRLAFR